MPCRSALGRKMHKVVRRSVNASDPLRRDHTALEDYYHIGSWATKRSAVQIRNQRGGSRCVTLGFFFLDRQGILVPGQLASRCDPRGGVMVQLLPAMTAQLMMPVPPLVLHRYRLSDHHTQLGERHGLRAVMPSSEQKKHQQRP